MLFEFFTKVSPPGFFGVPDGENLVLPAQPSDRQVLGTTLHTRALQAVGHGTLSQYRDEAAAVSLALEDSGVRLQARDNFFVYTAEGETVSAAYAVVRPVIERLMRLLTMYQGVVFTYVGQFVEGADEKIYDWPEPVVVNLAQGTVYDTATLREFISQGFAHAFREDLQSDRALKYFESALDLRDAAVRAAPNASRGSILQALAFLQLWKALTIILGEPGTDWDYQSRFKTFGLPKNYWKDVIEPLYRIRNDDDVAHYSLKDVTGEEVRQAFGSAVTACQAVLQAYLSHQPQPEAGQGEKDMTEAPNGWLRTDELRELVEALAEVAVKLEAAKTDAYAWKWAIIAMQNGVQNAMVAAISGTDNLGALSKEIAERWRASIETGANDYPEPWLAGPRELYKRMKARTAFPATPEIDEDFDRLVGFRNDFMHFTPKGWSLHLAGLPRVFRNVLAIVEHLDSKAHILWFEEEDRTKAQASIGNIRRLLGELEASYTPAP